jgi:hypothetical protein
VETAAEYEGVSVSDKLSIIITTHGKGRDLPGILSSIENQRQYRTGISTKGEHYNYEAGERFTKPNIEVVVTCDGPCTPIDIYPGVNRWVDCPKEGGVGHHTREPGIKAATGDWIVLTNSDNFFMHGWYHSLMQCMLPQYGVVYWDIVSNLWQWQARAARLEWGRVDLSSVCVRSEFAKQVGFPFRNYDGDWNYIDACSKLCHKAGLRQIHINEVLGVHN